MLKKFVFLTSVAIGIVQLSILGVAVQLPAAQVSIDGDDLGGVVTSPKGPEAGVWVIAETKNLPTGFRKIVVTDDRGRYVVPDLPKATYDVWVRGYGLTDSPKVSAVPGVTLNLTAVLAHNAREAAQYFPSNYWYSLLQVPPKSDFPGTGLKGNGLSENVKSQSQFIEQVKGNNCGQCHQIGDRATREIPNDLGHFDSSVAAWGRRLQSGQWGSDMSRRVAVIGPVKFLSMFAGWTDRIAAGEVPPSPPRPQGIERNIVISEWDWGGPEEYFHDEVATDRRHPEVNPRGLVYGVHEHSSDFMSVVDPVRNSAVQVRLSMLDPNAPFSTPQKPLRPSPYWGNETYWSSRATAHSAVMDAKGRVWITQDIRDPDKPPAFCGKGSSHPSAKVFQITRNSRQLSMFDPSTKQFTLIDTCSGTMHLNFAEDVNNTLWFSAGDDGVVGWLNTKMFDETHDAAKSQGWTQLVLDTNGNGKRDAYAEDGEPASRLKDTLLRGHGLYGIIPSPADGSIWGTEVNTSGDLSGFPGAIIRLSPGSNPPATALAERYEPPWNDPVAPVHGYAPRGLDIDRNGVVWTVLASGHLASFDRRKCKGVLNGPKATGQQCPEGWTLYQTPGPNFKGVTDSGSADINYYNWVDQFGTMGLGKNLPIAIGNGSDSLLPLMPDGKFLTFRVPYPMGFFAKSMDARIDDPNAGWKGRGLWSTYATQATWHIEGGKGVTSKAVKFQIRPNPLAK